MRYKLRLKDGMVLKREFLGQAYELLVVRAGARFRFRLGGKVFSSLTAAAESVRGKARGVSGPEFWRAPKEPMEDPS